MKLFGLLILLLINIHAFGQIQNQKQSMKSVDRIFDAYVKQEESAESVDNRREIEFALKSLQTKCDAKYYPKLIDVWMYYDPTDFPTRDMILPILLQHKSEALRAVDKRIIEKKECEMKDTAPYSDLLSLKDALE